jgi:LytS/YehU family sensor histidine kinase
VDEINHIEDYIALEKMRFHDTLDIDFNTNKIYNDLKIAPMLLLPFVENSFKHGTIKNGKLDIKISLKCEKNIIGLYIENTHNKTESTKNGIGLYNIKKRLDLLYSNNYDLEIENKNDLFKVNLKLKLN